jgi:hypothetical protein
MAMSTAARVSSRVHQLPEQSFVRVRDLEVRIGATRHAIEVALSRLAATETLHSVGRGLYWKGSCTREGMEPPSAVRFLGLTSQVPVAVHVAVPGRARAAMPGITFHARPYSRVLHALRPAEVAVLEVLRMWPSGIESDWSALRRRVIALIKQDVVRVPIVTAALRDERTPNARRHWQRLSERFTTSR